MEDVGRRRRATRRSRRTRPTPATTAAITARRAEVLDHRVVARGGGRPTRGTPPRGTAHAVDREHAAEDRRRVDPARPRIAGLAAGGTRPDAIAPATAPMQYGTMHRRDGEETRRSTRCSRRAHERLAEREARAAEHDAERGECQRDEQREHDRREGFGERGPQHHEAEDQPDVVGLPHRPDRVVDQRARPLAARRAAGGEVPEPRAEVGAAEQRVGGDRRRASTPGDDVGFGSSRLLTRPAPVRGRAPAAARAARTGTSRVVAHRPVRGTAGSSSAAPTRPSRPSAEVEHDHGDERDPDARRCPSPRPRPSCGP